MMDPPRKFFRLKPDGEVRLRFGYIIRCDEVVKDEQGNVVELRFRAGEGAIDTLFCQQDRAFQPQRAGFCFQFRAPSGRVRHRGELIESHDPAHGFSSALPPRQGGDMGALP